MLAAWRSNVRKRDQTKAQRLWCQPLFPFHICMLWKEQKFQVATVFTSSSSRSQAGTGRPTSCVGVTSAKCSSCNRRYQLVLAVNLHIKAVSEMLALNLTGSLWYQRVRPVWRTLHNVPWLSYDVFKMDILSLQMQKPTRSTGRSSLSEESILLDRRILKCF